LAEKTEKSPDAQANLIKSTFATMMEKVIFSAAFGVTGVLCLVREPLD
jgi:hypothetical protein